MAQTKLQQELAWTTRATVDRHVLVLFTRQLAIMLGTGVPIIHALETLGVQPDHPNFAAVVSTLSDRIAAGENFSAASGRFPRVFPRAYSVMIAIGEKTGRLDESLNRLADWMEADLATYQKVKSALTYPAFVLMLTFVLTLALFYSLIPSFMGVFEEMGTELPLITKIVMTISQAARQPGVWLIGIGLVAAGFFSLKAALKTNTGAVKIAELILSLPVLGPLLTLASNARFAAGMSALLAAGQDLPKSLTLAAETCQNPLIIRDAHAMADGIRMGSPLSEQLKGNPTFPPVFSQMIAAGEEASDLALMFDRTAHFCKSEVDYKLEAFSAALEPLLLLLVGSVVGTIIISIFIPLYGTLNKL